MGFELPRANGASVWCLDAREGHCEQDGFPGDSVLHLRARECGGGGSSKMFSSLKMSS